MRYVLTLSGCSDALPERALSAVRQVQGLKVEDAFPATLLISYDAGIAALKRQLPGWHIQPETWVRPAS